MRVYSPRLDKRHPINRGCVFAWDARNPTCDAAKGYAGTLVGSITQGATSSLGTAGKKFGGNWYYEDCVQFGDHQYTNTLHATPATWVYYYNQVTSTNLSLGCHCDYFSSGGWTFGTYYELAAYFKLELIRSSTDVRATFTPPGTGEHVLVCTYDGTNNYSGIVAYFDGTAAARGDSYNQDGSGIGYPVTPGDPLCISTNRFETASSFDGTIYCARAFNRVLDAQEIALISSDPYLGHESFIRRVYSTGGTAISASSAESASTQTDAIAAAVLVSSALTEIRTGQTDNIAAALLIASSIAEAIGAQTESLASGVRVSATSAESVSAQTESLNAGSSVNATSSESVSAQTESVASALPIAAASTESASVQTEGIVAGSTAVISGSVTETGQSHSESFAAQVVVSASVAETGTSQSESSSAGVVVSATADEYSAVHSDSATATLVVSAAIAEYQSYQTETIRSPQDEFSASLEITVTSQASLEISLTLQASIDEDVTNCSVEADFFGVAL